MYVDTYGIEGKKDRQEKERELTGGALNLV